MPQNFDGLPHLDPYRPARPDLFALGVACGFLGVIFIASLPLWKKTGKPSREETHRIHPVTLPSRDEDVQDVVHAPETMTEDSRAGGAEGNGPVPVAYIEREEHEVEGTPQEESEKPTDTVVFFIDRTPVDEAVPDAEASLWMDSPVIEGEESTESLTIESPPSDFHLSPAQNSLLPVVIASPDETPPVEGTMTLFAAGEIVRKGKALRRRVLAPNLGVIQEVFASYEPVTYKVMFFDGEDSQRDIYWEEDLVKLNPMETRLFLNDYPEEARETILRISARNTAVDKVTR